MKKILAFDLDGTLIDTTGIAFRRINNILNELGLPSLSHAVLKKFWGKKVKKLFRFICKEAGANKEQRKAFFKRDLEIISNFDFEVSEELLFALKSLKQNGILLALITSRSLNSLKKLAKKSGISLEELKKVFDFIQTGNCYRYKKPDGRVFRPLLRWAHSQGLNANNIVYFGDTTQYDLAATKNSKPKIDFIAVASGIHEVQDFYKAGLSEKEIISSFEELPSYLLKMNIS